MQLKKAKQALAVGAVILGTSSTAFSASESFDLTVTTLPDVAITELQALDFGSNMYVGAGLSCFMDAATPGDGNNGTTADMNYEAGGVAPSKFGELSGTGCVAAAVASPGIYELSGLTGLDVDVTVTGVTGTDFTFYPNSGCIENYDGGAAGDTCESFIPGAAETVTLADTGDDGNAADGIAIMTVGGTITIGGADLTANTAYTENFTIEVTY